jgi:DNA-damage-inducible protein J
MAYNIYTMNCEKELITVAKTTNFSVRMDSEIKKQCEELFGELGMNLTTAINVFLRQSLRVGGFPFDVTLGTPNAATIAAMKEAESISCDSNVKHYSDVEEALRELKK